MSKGDYSFYEFDQPVIEDLSVDSEMFAPEVEVPTSSPGSFRATVCLNGVMHYVSVNGQINGEVPSS